MNNLPESALPLTGKPKRYEWLCPLAACCSLLVLTVMISPHVPMWLDEVYTYYGVEHRSFVDLIQSYNTGFNTIPPMYPVAIWMLSKVIPLSVLSLRIYSSLCSGLGLCLLWVVLRRHFNFFVSSVAALMVCLTSSLFLFHAAEARFYGLYFALIAWTVYNYDGLCIEKPTTRRLFVNALSHALAISCTYAAGFYSLAILVALFIRDKAFSVSRPKVYFSVIAGWLPVLFYLPIIWAQKGEAGLINAPLAGAILHPFDSGLDIYFVFCALAGLFVITAIEKRNGHPADRESSGNMSPFLNGIHLLILSFAFLLVPYLLLFISWAGMPVLANRYVMPSLIGLAVLFAFMFAGLGRGSAETSRVCATRFAGMARLFGKAFRALLLGGLLLYPIKHAVSWVHQAAAVAKANPVPQFVNSKTVFATSDPHSYFSLYFYSGAAKNIYLIVRDRKEYERYKHFNRRLNPVTAADFLKSHRQFITVSTPDRTRWFENELQSNGIYSVELERQWHAASGPKKLFIVRRVTHSTGKERKTRQNS